jgi:hypothetical protein
LEANGFSLCFRVVERFQFNSVANLWGILAGHFPLQFNSVAIPRGPWPTTFRSSVLAEVARGFNHNRSAVLSATISRPKPEENAMSQFNWRSYYAGRNGGSSAISSTPGQPANAKDREVYWQGKAHAQWLKPPSSKPWFSSPASLSGLGNSGRGGGYASPARASSSYSPSVGGASFGGSYHADSSGGGLKRISVVTAIVGALLFAAVASSAAPETPLLVAGGLGAIVGWIVPSVLVLLCRLIAFFVRLMVAALKLALVMSLIVGIVYVIVRLAAG